MASVQKYIHFKSNSTLMTKPWAYATIYKPLRLLPFIKLDYIVNNLEKIKNSNKSIYDKIVKWIKYPFVVINGTAYPLQSVDFANGNTETYEYKEISSNEKWISIPVRVYYDETKPVKIIENDNNTDKRGIRASVGIPVIENDMREALTIAGIVTLLSSIATIVGAVLLIINYITAMRVNNSSTDPKAIITMKLSLNTITIEKGKTKTISIIESAGIPVIKNNSNPTISNLDINTMTLKALTTGNNTIVLEDEASSTEIKINVINSTDNTQPEPVQPEPEPVPVGTGTAKTFNFMPFIIAGIILFIMDK